MAQAHRRSSGRRERKARVRTRCCFEPLEVRQLLALTPTTVTPGSPAQSAGPNSPALSGAVQPLLSSSAIISTYAGSANTYGNGDPATLASVADPDGVAVDAAGDVFIADTSHNLVREVNHATGVITTVAGNGSAGYSGNKGPATAAALNGPEGLALDSAGDLFIADTGNYSIREVNHSTGIITTVAGNGTFGNSGDGGPATAGQFDYPVSVAVDSTGDLFIADLFTEEVSEVTGGILRVEAGNGSLGYGGDGGQAANAELDSPTGLALNSAGDLFIADAGNHRVREVNLTSGIISTFAGSGAFGFSGDGGPATAAELSVGGIAVDSSGDLFLADGNNERIREINAASNVITTVAGNGTAGYGGDGGQATAASLLAPSQVAVDSAGDLLIADEDNNRVREVSHASGVITTVAGNGLANLSGDGGLAVFAGLAAPLDVAVDTAGDVLIADDGDNVVREVNHATGIITTIAGTGFGGYSGDGGPATAAELDAPAGIAIDSAGDLFISDSGNNRIREVNHLTGIITTIAGTGTAGYSGDGGKATAAQIDVPLGLALDSAGDLFFADEFNGRVREINAATGNISTVAGVGTQGYDGDGLAATAAELSFPKGVAVDASGDLFIADSANDRVREVNAATGLISTMAGTGTAGAAGDGGPATAAMLSGPEGVTIDSSGNLYIADSLNQRIREVNVSTGLISTVAGLGTAGYSGDGGAATAAQLSSPDTVAFDSLGDMFIPDTNNDRIREVAVPPVQTTPAVAVTDAGGTYNGSAYPAAATVNGLASLEGVTPTLAYYSGTAVSGSPRASAPSHAGTYTVVASFAGSTDYTAAQSNSLTFIIGQAALKITANNQTKVYGAPLPTFTASYSGLAGSDTPASLTAQPTFSTTATATSPVVGGPYSITASGAVDPDYAITYFPGTLTVTAAPTMLSIVAASNMIPVGQSVTLTATVSSSSATASEGTVTFSSGSTTLGTAPVNGGLATLATTILPVGVDSISAAYADPVGNFTLSSTGTISTVAGSSVGAPIGGYAGDGGPATAAELDGPQRVAVDSAGDVFFADTQNNRIREVNHITGLITTVAGNGFGSGTGNTGGYSGDGGPATAAELFYPTGVAVDSAGDLFISDDENSRIREVNGTTGIITTVAGNGTPGFSGDGGQATVAELDAPDGIAVDASGDLLIADAGNGRIREVKPSGIITTVAGNGTVGSVVDGVQATATTLSGPFDIAVDSAGDLFIADYGNERVREVTPNGIITTLAGYNLQADTGDGGPATAAGVGNPTGVAVDSAGDVFIVENTGASVVREVQPNGIISTVAGVGHYGINGTTGPATATALFDPTGIAIDSANVLMIADTENNEIREVTLSATVDVLPTAHTPTVTNATAVQNGRSSSGLVITPNAQDVGIVTYFQITNITGGTLYLNDGATTVANGTFITAAEGAAGLKFAPALNSAAAGSFAVQASTSDTPAGLGGSIVTATITVTVVPPTSHVNPLGDRTSDTSIAVSWTGAAGSGGPIASYNILVSEDGGPFTTWLPATQATSATYTLAQVGHTYGFISQALDTAGNVEPAHATADTTVTVTATPWHNPTNPLDVLGTGGPVVPGDALAIIDYLNLHPGDSTLPTTAPAGSDYYDVLGSNSIVPADALDVINYLNLHPAVSALSPAVATFAPASLPVAEAVGMSDPASADAVAAFAAGAAFLAAPSATDAATGNGPPPVSPAVLAVSSAPAMSFGPGTVADSGNASNTSSVAATATGPALSRLELLDAQQATDILFAEPGDWLHSE